MDFIHTMEKAFGNKAIMDFQPMQPGDVYTTFADTSRLEHQFGYRPEIDLNDGISRFAEWFDNYYNTPE